MLTAPKALLTSITLGQDDPNVIGPYQQQAQFLFLSKAITPRSIAGAQGFRVEVRPIFDSELSEQTWRDGACFLICFRIHLHPWAVSSSRPTGCTNEAMKKVQLPHLKQTSHTTPLVLNFSNCFCSKNVCTNTASTTLSYLPLTSTNSLFSSVTSSRFNLSIAAKPAAKPLRVASLSSGKLLFVP